MERRTSALVLIILGLVALAFPLLSVIPFSVLTGFIVLILGIGLLLNGIIGTSENLITGILETILGIVILILGLGFVFNPILFSWFAAFVIWIVGLFLVIAGIGAVFSGKGGSRWNGIVTMVIGFLYIIIGTWIQNPLVLGALIGFWLLITGILLLFTKD